MTTDNQQENVFGAFDKKMEKICTDISQQYLPPRVAVLGNGLPLPIFESLITKGEISAAVSQLITMKDQGAISEDEYSKQMSQYTDAIDPKDVVDERLERYWRDLMHACKLYMIHAMTQFSGGDPSASAGEQMVKMASTMFSKGVGDPLFAPHLEISNDSVATAQSILSFLNQIAQGQNNDNIEQVEREQARAETQLNFSFTDRRQENAAGQQTTETD